MKEFTLKELSSMLEKGETTCVEVSLESRRIQNYETLLHEYKRDLNAYLSSMGDAVPLHSLAEIIDANRENPERNIPYGQDILEKAEEKSGTLTESEYLDARKTQLAQAGMLEQLLIDQELDAAVAVNPFPHGTIFGNPTLIVPAKALTDISPLSVVFTARKWQDDSLFAFASTYEKATQFRIAPDTDKRMKDFC